MKRLLIIICLGLAFIAAIKFQLLPQFNTTKVVEDVKNKEAFPILKHEDGIERQYFQK